MAWWRHNCETSHVMKVFVGCAKWSTLFSTITFVILDRFWYFCIIGNKNENFTKQIQIISLQPCYVSTLPDKTKNSTNSRPLKLLQHLFERIVPKFYRKSFSVRFFPYLLEHFFSSLSTKFFLHSCWFYQRIIFKLKMVDFNM